MNTKSRGYSALHGLLAAAMLALAAGAAVARSDEAPARIDVTWAPAEKLSEVKDNPINRGWLRTEEWQKQLGDHLRKRADRILPPGQHLQVNIDDIHLAGAFEPWHTRIGTEDIRFLKDIYPPRIDLHFKLIASDGATIREGDAKLRDGAYLQRAVIYDSNDPLRFDKRLIDDWLKREFGPKRS